MSDKFSDKDFIVSHRVRNFAWSMPCSHSHKTYEIYFLKSGSRTVISGGKVYNLGEGDVFLAKPNVFHYVTGNLPHERYNLEFSEQFLECFFSARLSKQLTGCFDNNFLHFHNEDSEKFCTLFSKMQNEYEHNELFCITFAELIKHVNETAVIANSEYVTHSSLYPQTLSSVIAYINRNYRTIKSVDEIAENCYISKTYLCRIFKKEFDTTVMKYLYDVRIQQACEMISSSDDALAEISELCGFDNTSHFSKVFKSHIGCTPREFRKSALSVE